MTSPSAASSAIVPCREAPHTCPRALAPDLTGDAPTAHASQSPNPTKLAAWFRKVEDGGRLNASSGATVRATIAAAVRGSRAEGVEREDCINREAG